jgi:translation initiation factor 4B
MTQIPAKVMNWADECEDDETGPRPLMALPTAPRAARILNDDTIPTQPPFNAFLSNLPYDIKEDDLQEFFDSLDIQTKSVRLPQNLDSSSRMSRGIGYVEYETREDLIEAISLPDPMMRNRRIRIDVSNPNEQKDRDRNQNRNQRYGNNEDRPERPLDTNWRQRTDKSPDRNGGEPPRENRRGYGGGFRDRERVRDASPRQDDGGSWRSARQADPSPPRRQFDREDR